MTLKLRPLTLLLLPSLVPAWSAMANEAEIEKIYVHGQRISAERLLLTEEDWQKRQARDLEDLFADQSAVAVGGALGVAQKLYLHGLEDLLLNVSLDGAIQSGSMFHHTGRLSLEPELLRQVEVQAGPGDATQGAGALGGSIDFVTKDATDLLAPDQRFSGLIKAAHASNNNSDKYGLTLAGRLTDNWSLLGSASRQNSDEFKDAEGQRWQGTAAEQEFSFAKLSGEIAEHHHIRLSTEHATDEGLRAQRPNWQISDWNRAYPLETERATHTLNYEFAPGSEWVELKFSGYQSDTELRQDARFGLYEGGVKNSGLDLRNSSKLGHHHWVYGVDYRKEQTDLTALNDPSLPTNREDARVYGVFLQDYWQLAKDWKLNAGARYDNYQVLDMNQQDLSSNGISPNLGLSWQSTETLRIYTGYSSTLRGRLTTNSFVLDNRTNAADLKAEEADHYQLGAEWQYQSWLLNANLFRNKISNAIAERARVYSNVGEVESKGYDLSLRYQQAGWQWLTSFSKTDATLNGVKLNAYDHAGLGTSTGLTVAMRLQYQLTVQWLTGAGMRSVEGLHQVQTSAGLIDQPGYSVFDAFARWQSSQIEGLSLTFALRNLSDKWYRDQATLPDFNHIPDYEGLAGLPEPGRDARVELAWWF